MFALSFTEIRLHWQRHNVTLRKHAHGIYTEIFKVVKSENFQKIFDIFLIFAQHIDCGYTLESPHRGGSNYVSFAAKMIKVGISL